MIKKVYFSCLAAVLLLVCYSTIAFSESTPGIYKWQQIKCADGVHTYETCQYNGDGNTCTNPGSITRKCPSITDWF